MMKNYATIDDSNICIGVSQLNAEVNDSNLIEIEKCDEYYLHRKYENGIWSKETYLPKKTSFDYLDLEQYMLDVEFRLTMIELGGM
ncbi:protein of unknown function [Acetoanaerobium sticklandii]|uniref:Uncharacterized protein n=2 Tax=Acetoanaerobium sticklandii TaxID=1511 RepID=E3PRX5_ACESD|nr:hypothetical protein [Acetoanaerobium sticklandii]CBH21629.1 protein of unknown function [Acetoanaerobium sticklandii]